MKNIISVASAKPDYDTRDISTQLAERVAGMNPEKKVLLLSSGECFDADVVVPVNVYPFLSIPVSKLPSGLYVFYVDTAADRNTLHPDMVIHFVRGLALQYDLVICDAGGRIEDAVALGCQFESDSTFYVFDHTKESISRFSLLKPLLDSLGIRIGGEILDHTKERPQYGYSEFMGCTGTDPDIDYYTVDDHKDIDILARSVSLGQFEQVRGGTCEDRGDR